MVRNYAQLFMPIEARIGKTQGDKMLLFTFKIETPVREKVTFIRAVWNSRPQKK